METISFMRGIRIEKPAEEVKSFLRQVPNLPRWTGFFLRVGAQDGAVFAVETVLGPARTQIDEEAGRLTIVSFFGVRRETASIEVEGRGALSEVRFHLRLPADLPLARIDGQLARLEGELRALRSILETPDHGAQPAGGAS